MPSLTFSTEGLAIRATPELAFDAGQGLHAKVNKNDLNEQGRLLSLQTIKNIMDYHDAHPELPKLNKYNPEVQKLFAKHETPRSILFFEDHGKENSGMAVLYRDFSKDTVNLNLLFETEVPKDLWSRAAREMIPCLMVDVNNKPTFFINDKSQKIPVSDDYPLELIDVINTNIGKELNARKVVLQSEDRVFGWLKSKGVLKGRITKEQGGGRLGAGSTTEGGGVKLAQDPLTKEWISVKVLLLKDFYKSRDRFALQELGELYGTVKVGEKGYIAGKLHHGMHVDEFLKCSAIKDLSNPRASIMLTLNIMQSLASEMQRIHDKGILHHDINPGNVLVDPYRQCVHFVDFGQCNSVKADDWRLLEESGMITQYLQALAFHPTNYLLEELVQERNKDLFYCLFCLPDKSDQFNFVPFIQRLSDALNNKSIQVPKEKMEELEDLRQKYIQQIAMSAKNYHALIEAENKKREDAWSSRDACEYIAEESIAEKLTSELEKIKANIDLDNIPENMDERNKVQAIRDKYLQAFNLIKNNRPVNSLTTQEVTDILVKYRIIEVCDARLDQSRKSYAIVFLYVCG